MSRSASEDRCAAAWVVAAIVDAIFSLSKVWSNFGLGIAMDFDVEFFGRKFMKKNCGFMIKKKMINAARSVLY